MRKVATNVMGCWTVCPTHGVLDSVSYSWGVGQCVVILMMCRYAKEIIQFVS